MVIIDAWMQHPSAELLADPMFDSLRRWAPGQLGGDEVPLETTVAAMDAAGVQIGMLCAWRGPRGPLIPNDAVAAAVSRYPGRFAGVAAVDLARPMDAVRELRRCVRDLGFRALRVVPWLWNLPPSDRRYYPLYAECVELGIPFCLQAGHTGPLCPLRAGPADPLPGHRRAGVPRAGHRERSYRLPVDRGDDLAGHQVPQRLHRHLRLQGQPLSPRPPVDYLRGHGRHKVLFGSDHPAWPAADCLAGLAGLQLDDQTTDLFLHGNAERVFGLTGARPGVNQLSTRLRNRA